MKDGYCNNCGSACRWFPEDGEIYEKEFCSVRCMYSSKFWDGDYYWCDDRVGQYSESFRGFFLCGDDDPYPSHSFKEIIPIRRLE